MLRKSLTLIAILGVFAAVRAEQASAQLLPIQILPQVEIAQLSCLGALQGAAALAQNPGLALAAVLSRIGVALGQVVGIPCLALINGRYVWEIWANTGGGPSRRVVDALTGAIVPGL